MKFSTVTWNSIKKFVFGDFNIHHKDWLIILVEVIDLVNFAIFFFISDDLTQMVTFPTQIPDSESHNFALLDLYFLLTLAFFPQWLSLTQEILIMLWS